MDSPAPLSDGTTPAHLQSVSWLAQADRSSIPAKRVITAPTGDDRAIDSQVAPNVVALAEQSQEEEGDEVQARSQCPADGLVDRITRRPQPPIPGTIGTQGAERILVPGDSTAGCLGVDRRGQIFRRGGVRCEPPWSCVRSPPGLFTPRKVMECPIGYPTTRQASPPKRGTRRPRRAEDRHHRSRFGSFVSVWRKPSPSQTVCAFQTHRGIRQCARR